MKWNEWAILIIAFLILTGQVYLIFFQSKPEPAILSNTIEKWHDTVIVKYEREKIIKEKYYYDSSKVYLLPDSLLFRTAYENATKLLGQP